MQTDCNGLGEPEEHDTVMLTEMHLSQLAAR